MKILDFSQKGFNFKINVSDEGRVSLRTMSRSTVEHIRDKDAWGPLVEIHLCGENPNDHHMAKHTGGSATFSLKYKSHKYYENELGNKLELTLCDSKMEVCAHFQFYKDISAFRTWTTVVNIGKEPMGLEYVSSFSYAGIDEGEKEIDEKMRILIPHNAWCREANWHSYTPYELGYSKMTYFSGKRILVSNTGTWSAKEYLPLGAYQNLETENTVMWQIEHNGSWAWEISDIDRMLYLKVSGPNDQEHDWYKELKTGEAFETVKVAFAIGADFNDAIKEMTSYRRTIIASNKEDKALPIIFNDYMNCLMGDTTEEKSLPIIDRAAKIGAEYYCVDAGWYADGTWWDSVGEWKPSSWRFPSGLKSLFDKIHARGMVPGIWLEPEVMGINCPLAKDLPDSWFFMRHGKRVIDHGRYQLDFRNEAVRKFVTDTVDRLIRDYGVGYFKLDYNIEAGRGTQINSDSLGDGLLGHNRAYLNWLRAIKEKHPHLIIENCSSGSLRMDYAQLSVCHLQSVSDQEDYRFNAKISAAASTAVVPEQGAIWSYPLASADRNEIIVNMVNSLLKRVHLSGEIQGWNDEQAALVKEALDLYKQIRKDIPNSIPFYPFGMPEYSQSWMCEAYKLPSKIRMAVWRMDDSIATKEIPLCKKIKSAKILYPSSCDGKVALCENGISVTLNNPCTAAVIECSLED
ncbi:MAG: alpha-galactosidase [Clostridia bacterium]|nr:alpha-galactosidase [Clostridia bacterium]